MAHRGTCFQHLHHDGKRMKSLVSQICYMPAVHRQLGRLPPPTWGPERATIRVGNETRFSFDFALKLRTGHDKTRASENKYIIRMLTPMCVKRWLSDTLRYLKPKFTSKSQYELQKCQVAWINGFFLSWVWDGAAVWLQII